MVVKTCFGYGVPTELNRFYGKAKLE